MPIEPALHICGFCIGGINQEQIKNIYSFIPTITVVDCREGHTPSPLPESRCSQGDFAAPPNVPTYFGLQHAAETRLCAGKNKLHLLAGG